MTTTAKVIVTLSMVAIAGLYLQNYYRRQNTQLFELIYVDNPEALCLDGT